MALKIIANDTTSGSMLAKVNKKLPEKLRKNIMRRETVNGFQTVPWNSAWTKQNSSALQKCSTLY